MGGGGGCVIMNPCSRVSPPVLGRSMFFFSDPTLTSWLANPQVKVIGRGPVGVSPAHIQLGLNPVPIFN